VIRACGILDLTLFSVINAGDDMEMKNDED
jgi:hypothetical protein